MILTTAAATRYHCDHRDCLCIADTPRTSIVDGREYRRLPEGWVVVRAMGRGTADLCQHHRALARVGCFSLDDVLWTREIARNEGVQE